MKHFLIIFTITLLSATTLHAQKLTCGVKGGINVSKWDFHQDQNTMTPKNKTGVEGGMYANIKLARQLSLRSEILYSQYGTGLEMGDESVNYKTAYIMIPVLARYTIPFSGLSLLAGPELGLLTSGHYTYEGSKHDLKKYLNSSNLFGVIGAEYELSNGINFAARYNFSIGHIQNEGETEIRELAFGLSVGYEISRLLHQPKSKTKKKK